MNKNMIMEIINDTLVINFYGEVDNAATTSYKEQIINLIEERKFKKVIMDFENVTFVDSSGIGMILGRYNQLKKYKGNLYVSGVNPQINKIFNIAGIWTIIDKYDFSKEMIDKAGIYQ